MRTRSPESNNWGREVRKAVTGDAKSGKQSQPRCWGNHALIYRRLDLLLKLLPVELSETGLAAGAVVLLPEVGLAAGAVMLCRRPALLLGLCFAGGRLCCWDGCALLEACFAPRAVVYLICWKLASPLGWLLVALPDAGSAAGATVVRWGCPGLVTKDSSSNWSLRTPRDRESECAIVLIACSTCGPDNFSKSVVSY
ncbi:hypothetical protein CDL15_Pgr000349 [Punica granatum]|uniref:Uncharacterized protein n=1 Tax=Punica granatum TaxID=22663 RepID=A0A218XUK1_PUNGR|nr:hypothetical protein CDL15_Pgr000349 [Punica granatum]